MERHLLSLTRVAYTLGWMFFLLALTFRGLILIFGPGLKASAPTQPMTVLLFSMAMFIISIASAVYAQLVHRDTADGD